MAVLQNEAAVFFGPGRRRRAVSVAVSLGAAALLVFGAATWVYVQKARQRRAARDAARERDATLVAREQAELRGLERQRSVYADQIGLAEAALKSGQFTRVREHLDACPPELR